MKVNGAVTVGTTTWKELAEQKVQWCPVCDEQGTVANRDVAITFQCTSHTDTEARRRYNGGNLDWCPVRGNGDVQKFPLSVPGYTQFGPADSKDGCSVWGIGRGGSFSLLLCSWKAWRVQSAVYAGVSRRCFGLWWILLVSPMLGGRCWLSWARQVQFTTTGANVMSSVRQLKGEAV